MKVFNLKTNSGHGGSCLQFRKLRQEDSQKFNASLDCIEVPGSWLAWDTEQEIIFYMVGRTKQGNSSAVMKSKVKISSSMDILKQRQQQVALPLDSLYYKAKHKAYDGIKQYVHLLTFQLIFIILVRVIICDETL